MKLHEFLEDLNSILDSNPSASNYDVVFINNALDFEDVVDCSYNPIRETIDLC